MIDNVLATLRAARDLVARPGGWSKGAYVRDGIISLNIDEQTIGEFVFCHGKDYCAFCVEGAVLFVAPGLQSAALDLLERAAGCAFLYRWNDAPGRKQSEVVTLFDRAIALAEGES